MAARNDESLLFVVEWFDPMPQMKKQYLLKYFPDQHAAEMVDFKSKKVFLKKSPCPPHVTRDEFYVGGKVILYSRELDIIDYGDLKTKDKLAYQAQQVVIVLSGSLYAQWGKIVHELTQSFNLIQIRTIAIPSSITDKVLSAAEDSSNKRNNFAVNNVALGLLITAADGYSKVQNVINQFQASSQVIYSKNGMQASELAGLLSLDPNQRLSSSATLLPSTCTLDSCTCCIVKPHAVKAKHVGLIMDHIITQGYEISAVKSILFEKVQAEEFLEVYKGVIPEYSDHVVHFASGLSVAMEIRAENAVETFRVTAGPWDVNMAKDLRPDTIRGMFGLDGIMNGVHCTDLPEDAELECEYCFKLI